jgi:2-dehydro-3-deoxyphosphogluconate aldolase / (4S)-4-hydroxy-2-oxoglutarate aldolase
MTKEKVCALIRQIGILPAIRVPAAEDALFAANQMAKWGIPIIELTMTVPGALDVIRELARTTPKLTVGAGTVCDVATAGACLDAGASFITSPGLDVRIVEFTLKNKLAAIPGVLTPSEVMAAHQAGADMIKIFPCSQVGGPEYIKALRSPFPDIPILASGGVTQQNAAEFIRRGATALGIRGELIPPAAIQRRDENWIHELTGRFLGIVQRARDEFEVK